MRLSPTGLHFWPREGSWTVGGRGRPGLTQGRRTENHDVSRLASRVAVSVGNLSHSYHPEGFYTGARSPEGNGSWNSCNTLPHCLGAVCSATPAMHCRTAWGQWAVQLLQRTASLLEGSGQWDCRNAPPH